MKLLRDPHGGLSQSARGDVKHDADDPDGFFPSLEVGVNEIDQPVPNERGAK